MLRVTHMGFGFSWHRIVILSLLVLGQVADASLLEVYQDEGPRETRDNEFFPLLQDPAHAPPPIRSELPSASNENLRRETKARILNDFGQRLTPEFQIPEALKARVGFWFDIYTRWGESHHIIHHERYPWVIFRIVDTTQTLLNGKGPLWLRRDRGSKMAKAQAADIRAALKRLAKRSNYDSLSGTEKELFDKLAAIPGSRKAVIKMAANSVRSQLGQRDFYERGLINSSRYLPYMEEEFRRRGLPTELTRLPFVESSFNEDAYSKVGASGIWQIMPLTGRAYMIVEPHVDERNSPLKATAAAARLLRSYYRALGSWPLALTSYNNGIGNIQKAIKGAGTRELSEIIERYHKGDFRFASSNFFTCFLAALYAERYNELLFNGIARQPLQVHETISLSGKTSVRQLLKISGLSKDELLKYNLDLRAAFKTNGSAPRGFQLHLPIGYKDRFERQIGTEAKRSKKRAV